jgi:hypothetical protein
MVPVPCSQMDAQSGKPAVEPNVGDAHQAYLYLVVTSSLQHPWMADIDQDDLITVADCQPARQAANWCFIVRRRGHPQPVWCLEIPPPMFTGQHRRGRGSTILRQFHP